MYIYLISVLRLVRGGKDTTLALAGRADEQVGNDDDGFGRETRDRAELMSPSRTADAHELCARFYIKNDLTHKHSPIAHHPRFAGRPKRII